MCVARFAQSWTLRVVGSVEYSGYYCSCRRVCCCTGRLWRLEIWCRLRIGPEQRRVQHISFLWQNGYACSPNIVVCGGWLVLTLNGKYVRFCISKS